LDWFKIKVHHILNSPYTDEELGRLIKIQALVASKERVPSNAELSTIIRLSTVDKLAKKLQSFGDNLQSIVNKVLEDVEKSAKNKGKTREKVAKYRENLRGKSCLIDENVTGYVTDGGNRNVTDSPHVRTGEIREDKRREEKKPLPLTDKKFIFEPNKIDGLDVEAWTRYTSYRKGILKPIKSPSLESAAKKMAEFGVNQAAVVEQSIAAGWQGLFALKSKPDTGEEFDHGISPEEREKILAEVKARAKKW
jgi:hypothetical protein